MKLNRALSLSLLQFIFILPSFAQNDGYSIYKAYVDKDMDLWQNVINERRAKENPSVDYLQETLNFEYGFVAWSLSKSDKSDGISQKYLDYANADLKKYESMNGAIRSRVAAYRSAFLAYEMKLHPFMATFIGVKCIKLSKEAVEVDSCDYFAYIQRGNVLYYLPQALGGSKDQAIKSYEKARKIMQKNFDLNARNNWLYLNLLLTLANAYKEKHDFKTVKTYYDSVLAIAPDFEYVKELYKSLPDSLKTN